MRSRKIFLQNPLIIHAARGHHVRAFLAETEAVTKATAAKNEIRSGTRDFKARTLQDIPPKHAPDDDLEIPATHCLSLLPFERYEFSAARFVALADDYLIQTSANISAGVTLQSAEQITSRNRVC